MFEFEKQYKSYEQTVTRIKEMNDFWLELILSSTKEFFKIAKTK